MVIHSIQKQECLTIKNIFSLHSLAGLFLCLGTLSLSLGIAFLVSQNIFMQNTNIVDGKITEYVLKEKKLYPKVEFITENKETIHFVSNIVLTRYYQIGAIVKVIYKKSNPSKSQIYDKMVFFDAQFIAIKNGIMFIIIGFLIENIQKLMRNIRKVINNRKRRTTAST